MEKKKLETFVSGAGNRAKDILGKSKEKVVSVIDQNDDGKLDLKDVSAIAGTVGGAVSKGARQLKASADEKSRQLELKQLRPIFPEEIEESSFQMSKLIRITERDRKHAESEACQGSIGYYSEHAGLTIINIFRDSVNRFGLSCFPDEEHEFYYVDPSDKTHYILLDDYFSHLKVVRVNELQRIAQDLGATHFCVTYREEQLMAAENKVKVHGKGHLKTTEAAIDIDHASKEKQFSKVEIAAEMTFPGHEPAWPELQYLKNDPCIINLVTMRMHPTSPVLSQKLQLTLSNSSGMTENDAAKIDAAVSAIGQKNIFKGTVNANVAIEAKKESHRYLEYEIDFQ